MINLDITTTAGEVFLGSNSADLAGLIYRRWGRDSAAAASAWCRMMQNSCTNEMFMALVKGSKLNDEK